MNFRARKARSNDKHRERQWLTANLWTLFVEVIDFKRSCFWSSRLARVNCLIYHQNKWPQWWTPPGRSKLCRREESFHRKDWRSELTWFVQILVSISGICNGFSRVQTLPSQRLSETGAGVWGNHQNAGSPPVNGRKLWCGLSNCTDGRDGI